MFLINFSTYQSQKREEYYAFATDLDRTIIYSNKFVENYQTVSCVEHLAGREIPPIRSHKALELLAQVKTL